MLRKLLKITLYTIAGAITLSIVITLFIWIKSPGKAQPIEDKSGNPIPGSISVIEKVKLGGIDQYLIIRGQDSLKPVMLYLHGGPGSPEFPFMKETNTDIEKDFVMVYWEQRCAGKSFSDSIATEGLSVETLISDTRELSQILAKRFKKEKIYLLGHSWGSFLGIQTVARYPELFHAYFSVGQVCYQYRGEQLSYEWVKKEAELKNDKKSIQKLAEIHFPDSAGSIQQWMRYLMPERGLVMKLGGGVMHKMDGMWPLIKIVLFTQEYTLKEKINYAKGNLVSLRELWPSVIHSNLVEKFDSVQVPVYFFQGKFDYQTPTSLAYEFYTKLKAPVKEFYLFENSAHSPMMEEIEKFNKIVASKITEEKNEK
ncbi:MAG: alpha/beta hydrolase [Bacteroidales bacterium]